MTRNGFLQSLRENNIDESLVSFGPAFREGHCVRHIGFRWEVFIRERGKDYDVMGFPSESDALQYLFEKLHRIYPIEKHNAKREKRLNLLATMQKRKSSSRRRHNEEECNYPMYLLLGVGGVFGTIGLHPRMVHSPRRGVVL